MAIRIFPFDKQCKITIHVLLSFSEGIEDPMECYKSADKMLTWFIYEKIPSIMCIEKCKQKWQFNKDKKRRKKLMSLPPLSSCKAKWLKKDEQFNKTALAS